MEVKYIKELREGLIKELEKIESEKERQELLAAIVEYCMMLERKQMLRLVLRESYYRVAYHVYNYLRRNGQLARREGAFDKDVKLVLSCTLSRFLEEYGCGED